MPDKPDDRRCRPHDPQTGMWEVTLPYRYIVTHSGSASKGCCSIGSARDPDGRSGQESFTGFLVNNLPPTPTFFSQIRILNELWACFVELRIPKDLLLTYCTECQATPKNFQRVKCVQFLFRVKGIRRRY
jgi:hypothetical protein